MSADSNPLTLDIDRRASSLILHLRTEEQPAKAGMWLQALLLGILAVEASAQGPSETGKWDLSAPDSHGLNLPCSDLYVFLK